MPENELTLLADAHRRAASYLRGIDDLPVFPDATAQATLEAFDEALPAEPSDPAETLKLLDEVGSPAGHPDRSFGVFRRRRPPAGSHAARSARASSSEIPSLLAPL